MDCCVWVEGRRGERVDQGEIKTLLEDDHDGIDSAEHQIDGYSQRDGPPDEERNPFGDGEFHCHSSVLLTGYLIYE